MIHLIKPFVVVIRRRKNLFLATLVILFSFINLNQSQKLNANKLEQETAIKELAINKAEPSYINLRAILEHQEALELECSKYHDDKIKHLEKLIKFNDENKNTIHISRPLQVKVPAVCLFLFASFGHVEKMLDNNKIVDSTQQESYNQSFLPNRKLEIINWIFNEDELRKKLNNVTVKREANDIDDIEMQDKLLRDYLYDDSNFDYNGGEQNNNFIDSEDPRSMKLHENMDKIIHDEQFKNMIDHNRDRIGDSLSPVILIPGLLGSRLQARTDKSKKVNIFCSKHSDWQDLWLSVKRLLPLAIDCWVDNIRLEYNPVTGFTKSPKGVESRVADFGSVESVRYMDVTRPSLSDYMAPLIERYEILGYTVDKNLLAAPYDFRLGPQELEQTYFKDLKALIEKAYKQSGASSSGLLSGSNLDNNSNNKSKVTLVCHSMGCTNALVFLRKQSSAWRQSRIRKLIALSSPWAGSTKALKAITVGDQLDLPLISEIKMRKLARTYPSVAYLLPQQEVFNKANALHDNGKNGAPTALHLVETPQRTYTINDLPDLLRDLNLHKQLKWFNETASLIRPLEPIPDLHVDCIHTLNAPTPQTLVFKKQSDFPNGDYQVIKGQGDGTVNIESLMVCADWANKLPDKVVHKIIKNTNHNGILSHKITLMHITDDTYLF